MAKLSEIMVDVKAQEEGQRLPHPIFNGVDVLVRGDQCEKARKRRALLQNRLPQKRRKTGDALLAHEEIERLVTAEMCGGWWGIEGEDGKPIEYTEERCREWAALPEYRRFFEGIRELAAEIGNAETEVHEESLRD